MKKRFAVFAALLVLATFCAPVAGCGHESGVPEETAVEVTEKRAETAAEPSRTVTMNGRSVMGGWMEHWGYGWDGPVEENGYYFDYRELDGSDIDNMASSFASNVEDLPPGSVVFFKFCFADFYGDNLRRLERTVDEVIRTTRDKGLRLVLGNALPVRKQDGSSAHVAEYEAYNAFLDGRAAGDENVRVYDFYSVLAGNDGFLKPGYDTGDSHLNERAYEALDATFFPFLEEVFAGSPGP